MPRIHHSIAVIAIGLAGSVTSAHATHVFNAFPRLTPFTFPTAVEDPFDGTDRLFVVERAGRVHVFQNDPTVTQRTLFLDIADSVTTQTEGGLLDIVFHPQYEVNRHFYVVYTRDNPRRWILARFTTDASDASTALRSSELHIINIPKVNLFHNAGCLEFGPDGYLYVSLGDDGNTVIQNAQNLAVLFGKVLRIDVNNPTGGKNYGIPPDNPFAGNQQGYREEIWAYGFRNPWRFSFDPPTGRLWSGDVGQETWEEINVILKGRNYGWPRLEGDHCYYPVVCDTAGLNLAHAVYKYNHNVAPASVTGGVVYRGPSNPGLVGKYIWAEFITSQISALTYGFGPPVNQPLTTLFRVSSFGVDKSGELFMASFNGAIYRLFESMTGVRAPAPLAGSIGAVSPNPFQSVATIAFVLEKDARATIEIFDVAGHRVTTLLDRRMERGSHDVSWNGGDDRGSIRASGVYLCRLVVDGRPAATKRVVLLK